MSTIKVTGTLFWETGLEASQSGRIEGAVVKYETDSKTGSVITDDDGDFAISAVDEAEDLVLTLLHEHGRSFGVTFAAGEFRKPLVLRVIPKEGRSSQIAGAIMLIVLAIALLFLTLNYFSAHQATMSQANEKYAALIEALESLPTTTESALPDALSTQQDRVRAAKLAVDGLRTSLADDVDALIVSIVTYEVQADAEDLSDLAGLLRRAEDRLRDPVDRFFWNKWPWRLVEIWAWGLLGVLLTKIVRIGWYLRTSSYQKNGTWMHIAHIIATPFLALVSVLVLSFLKIEGESQTIVDFGNPVLMVVAACLLSTNPWGLWDFVLGQGDAIRTKASAVKTS